MPNQPLQGQLLPRTWKATLAFFEPAARDERAQQSFHHRGGSPGVRWGNTLIVVLVKPSLVGRRSVKAVSATPSLYILWAYLSCLVLCELRGALKAQYLKPKTLFQSCILVISLNLQSLDRGSRVELFTSAFCLPHLKCPSVIEQDEAPWPTVKGSTHEPSLEKSGPSRFRYFSFAWTYDSVLTKVRICVHCTVH